MRKTIDELARSFVRLHREQRILRQQRNLLWCKNETGESGSPCWRQIPPCPDWALGERFIDSLEWCPACIKRQDLEEMRRIAARKRGAALRALENRVMSAASATAS